MYSIGCLSMLLICLKFQADVNALDDENIVLQFHFADGFRDQPLIRSVDLTRLQRASKGSRKSTGRGSDNIVQSRGVGFQHVRWNFVMLGHRAVNTENHRF